MENEVIKVACVVAPDAQVFWSEIKDGVDVHDSLTRLWSAWKDSLPLEKSELYESSGVLGGVVIVRMLREDYMKIPATSQSAAIFAAAGL